MNKGKNNKDWEEIWSEKSSKMNSWHVVCGVEGEISDDEWGGDFGPWMLASGLVSGDDIRPSASSSFVDVRDFQSNGDERTQHNLQPSNKSDARH